MFNAPRHSGKTLFTSLCLSFAAVLSALLPGGCSAPDASTSPLRSGLGVMIDDRTGGYEIISKNPAWHFGGNLGSPIKNVEYNYGSDSVGPYWQMNFEWHSGRLPMSGGIRFYQEKSLALFTQVCGAATETPPPPFPSFTRLPGDLNVFSYQQQTFAAPQFAANECSTPWLLFDNHANAMVISPASHFMVASMIGNGRQQVAIGLDSRLRNLPAGFTQQTLLAIGKGINRTWDLWSQGMIGLAGVKRPANDADATLKYLGYWTDNGAYYYYNYDLEKGYAGTLQSLAAHYRQEQIPIRYLQLDSWWYYKSFMDADGKMGKAKSAKLPQGEWNRYGGLLEYKAHPFLFPDGLDAFQKSIGLPLVTHNRWIDPASPYHEKYNISGVAAVDPKWWDDITDYLKSSGVVSYEQDWCDRIYKYSPAFSSNIDTGEAFLNNMARACKEKGITMQYCMPYPCFFLQGSRYDNLTTIRTSQDVFGRARWNDFLYCSRLAHSMGIWPWSDVYKSAETNNLLLSTLSAGPVGIGDAIGSENKLNLFKAVRSDGVIVKPDVPILPLDKCYIADAQHMPAPLIASTHTDHDGLRTAYVFAFNRPKTEGSNVVFASSELGFAGQVYVYDCFSGAGRLLDAKTNLTATLDKGAVAFYVVAPVGKSGIAFLGDTGKFVSTGKQRIASIRDDAGKMVVTVNFAAAENSVTLHGYAAAVPTVTLQSGKAGDVQYEPATRHFTVQIAPDPAAPADSTSGDPVSQITVTLQTRAD
jgi:hypothetical protein